MASNFRQRLSTFLNEFEHSFVHELEVKDEQQGKLCEQMQSQNSQLEQSCREYQREIDGLKKTCEEYQQSKNESLNQMESMKKENTKLHEKLTRFENAVNMATTILFNSQQDSDDTFQHLSTPSNSSPSLGLHNFPLSFKDVLSEDVTLQDARSVLLEDNHHHSHNHNHNNFTTPKKRKVNETEHRLTMVNSDHKLSSLSIYKEIIWTIHKAEVTIIPDKYKADFDAMIEQIIYDKHGQKKIVEVKKDGKGNVLYKYVKHNASPPILTELTQTWEKKNLPDY